MEDEIGEYWRVVEHTYYLEEEEVKESKMRWILNKGLGFGKKVVMTGLLITSAPLVLPPLIVISALGFACSVPFGLALAGYTCTEKLMNKLLPRKAPLLLEYYGDDEEEYYGEPAFTVEMVMEEAGLEEGVELVMDKEEVLQGENEDLVGLPDRNIYEHSLENATRLEDEKATQSDDRKQTGLEESVQVPKIPSVSKSSKKHQKKKKANYAAISHEGKQEHNDSKPVEIKEKMTDDEKHLPVKKKGGNDESNVTRKAKKADNNRDVGGAAKLTKDHNVKYASAGLENKDAIVSGKEAQWNPADVHGNQLSQRKASPDQQKNANGRAGNQVSGREGVHEPKTTKELFSEEKIWEKINAMRTIVGYTAAPQPFLTDEVKALYIFTGVEPPPLFTNPSDLAEANDKLHFLMSIVGIK